MSYFDNFFVTLVLCVGGGFATDNLNKYIKVGNTFSRLYDSGLDFIGKRGAAPKPEVAAAKVEETLTELKESAKSETANLIDHLS